MLVVCPRRAAFAISCFSSRGHLQLFLLNDKLLHYCIMILVVAFGIPSMKSCFWIRHMLLIVRISSVDQFYCTRVLSAIFCLLVRGVGLLLVIVAFSSTTVKFVSLKLLLCKILFDLFLAEGTFYFMVLSKTGFLVAPWNVRIWDVKFSISAMSSNNCDCGYSCVFWKVSMKSMSPSQTLQIFLQRPVCWVSVLLHGRNPWMGYLP